MDNKDKKTLITAFVISLVAANFFEIIIIGYYLFAFFGIALSSFSTMLSIVFVTGLGLAPLVLGAIALKLLKDVGEIIRPMRPFYIITKVLSIISIIASAILGSIVLFVYFIAGFIGHFIYL